MTTRGAVLVTGGGRRLGRAIAVHLGCHGYPVVAHYRNSVDGAQSAAAKIQAAGGKAGTVRADLSDPEACRSLPGEAAAVIGQPIANLVHAASIFEFDRMGEVTAETWDRHLAINARAAVLIAQALASALPPELTGSIVCMLDQKLWNLNPDFFAYTVSKQALLGACQLMARALAPRLRVNCVAPGWTLPNPGQDVEEFRRFSASLPLGRAAGPDDVTAAVAYLLGAGAVTGQTITVDGGEYMVPRRRDPMFGDE